MEVGGAHYMGGGDAHYVERVGCPLCWGGDAHDVCMWLGGGSIMWAEQSKTYKG